MPSKKRKAPVKKKPESQGLDFNHAMIYTQDAEKALKFYSGHLGFKSIDAFRHEGRLVYARLRSPQGNATIALHMLEPGKSVRADEGVRLYFEVKNLEGFCKKLEASGIPLDKQPKLMPWGWHHAYLRDPDGHEISLYWAGAKRFQPTTLKR
jgi:catechol 2,3-dioxygenase-like lactoylglutathione lyase family enzyme